MTCHAARRVAHVSTGPVGSAERSRFLPPTPLPADAVTFVIADLCGYTALTEAHGGAEAATTVARYRSLAEHALADGARIIEQVGDELLIVADDAHAALASALSIRDAVDAEPCFPSVRMGVHGGGAVVERAGHYFGAALNLTARLAACAGVDEIICSATVARVCRDFAGVAFHGLGPRHFKNVAAPVDVFTVVAGRANGSGTVVDPVCRMRLKPDAAVARFRLGTTTYAFCSLECRRVFAVNPEWYDVRR